MVPLELRRHPHVSFTQIDQYLRCPLKYKSGNERSLLGLLQTGITTRHGH